jgi:hypothetical protein
MLTAAAATRWECDALEYSPAPSAVYLRLCGPEPALDSLAQEILARWPGQKLSPTEAEGYWTGLREFRWSPAEDALLKVAITPALVEEFCRLIQEIPEGRLQIGAAGNVAYLSLPASAETKKLDEALQDWGVAALALRGDVPLWLGAKGEGPITAAVKKALDPENRFLSLSE